MLYLGTGGHWLIGHILNSTDREQVLPSWARTGVPESRRPALLTGDRGGREGETCYNPGNPLLDAAADAAPAGAWSK